jgi:hypothetical protein
VKRCGKCGKEKPETEFAFRQGHSGRLRSYCKLCMAAYHHAWIRKDYLARKDYCLTRVIARRKFLKSEARRQMLDYLKGKSCEFCGESDIRTLDFDHIDPSIKSFSVAHGIGMAMTWKAIFAEIQKCRLICANCHRKRTAEQFGWYRQAA